MLTMVFKLCRSAEKRWRRLQGYRRLTPPYTTFDNNSVEGNGNREREEKDEVSKINFVRLASGSSYEYAR